MQIVSASAAAYPGTIDSSLKNNLDSADAQEKIAIGVWFSLTDEEKNTITGSDNETHARIVGGVMDRYRSSVEGLFSDVTFVGKYQPVMEGHATPENIVKMAALNGISSIVFAEQETKPAESQSQNETDATNSGIFMILLEVDGKKVDFSGNEFYKIFNDDLDEQPSGTHAGVDYYNTADFDAAQARGILRYAVKTDKLPGSLSEAKEFLFESDTDFDGVITAADARNALRIAVGLEKAHEYKWLTGSSKDASK